MRGKVVLTNNLSERIKKYESEKQVKKSINICVGICHTVWHDSGKCNGSQCCIGIRKPEFFGEERYGVHRI